MKPWAPTELLFSSAYGGDPGTDEVMFTADDLDYAPVVQQVKDSYITFVVVDCQADSGSGYYDDAHNNFNYLAYMTDGSVFPYASETIADDIIARIQEIAERLVGVLTLERDAAYASWVSWTPTAYHDVSWGSTVSFEVDITVPTGTLPGNHIFDIRVMGDGVALGTVTVTKSVRGIGVGGIWVPADKLGLLAPYIGLASTILVATVATAVYAKHIKRRKEKQ